MAHLGVQVLYLQQEFVKKIVCDTPIVIDWLGNKFSGHGYHLHYNVFRRIAMLFKSIAMPLQSIVMEIQSIVM